jgi:hypothetical protein
LFASVVANYISNLIHQGRSNDAGVSTDGFQKQNDENHQRMADRVNQFGLALTLIWLVLLVLFSLHLLQVV